jgi:flavin reductase (DIM6/NTAB) family NADH-FMN oxidoreductase RutF
MSIDRDAFRNVIGHFASGVTVITSRSTTTDVGLTASAVSSLSLDPPMLLVCINRAAATCTVVAETRRFVVNILREDQAGLAMQFAKPGAPDKFAGINLARSADGLPLLPGALAHIECRVVNAIDGGSHTVFLAEVESASSHDGAPLLYFRGKMGKFSAG